MPKTLSKPLQITFITLDNWGFNKYLVDDLKAKGHTVNHIDYDKFRYEYPSFVQRVKNFFSKTFFKVNVKKEVLHDGILQRLDKLPKQDIIIMIKADYLLPKTIAAIKPKCDRFIAFFNDNYRRAANIKNVYSYFDTVYSFEKEDVDQFGFKFATNFIYKQIIPNRDLETDAVFNVSSYDQKRLKIIEGVAHALDTINEPYTIVSVGKKAKPYAYDTKINYTTKKINLDEMESYITKSKALLDVHRDNQNGLTFRVFESLGYKKKLITTNSDITTYDFYNPNNILVIDKDNIVVPEDFFKTPYQDVPDNIYNAYVASYWVDKLLSEN